MFAQQVLKKDPKNAKALYRRGQANFGLNDYEMAIKDLKKAKALQPGDSAIIKEIQQVKSAAKIYLKKEKVQFEKMFKV